MNVTSRPGQSFKTGYLQNEFQLGTVRIHMLRTPAVMTDASHVKGEANFTHDKNIESLVQGQYATVMGVSPAQDVNMKLKITLRP